MKMRSQRRFLKQKNCDAFAYDDHGEGVKNDSSHVPRDFGCVEDDRCCPLLTECC